MSNIVKMTLGQRFQKYRIDKGFSQAELSEGICSPATVSHLETDRTIPSAKILSKLAERLEVPLREVMGMQEAHLDIKEKIAITKLYVATSDLDHAMKLIGEMLNRDDLLDHQKREILIYKSECLTKSGSIEEAIGILQSLVMELEFQKSMDDELLCDLYNRLGNAYFYAKDLSKAFSVYERAYQITLRFPEYDALAAKVSKNLGIACNQLGMYDEAKVYLEKAYTFFQRISDIGSLADSLFSLAIATGKESYLQQAASLYESLEALRESEIVKQYYSFHMESKKDYNQAVSNLRNIALQLDKLGDKGAALFTLSRAVIICLDHNDIKKAIEQYEFATLYKDGLANENPYDVALYYRVRARINLVTGEYDKTIHFAKKSSDLYGMIGMNLDASDSLEVAFQALQQVGRFEEACEVANQMNSLLRTARRKIQ